MAWSFEYLHLCNKSKNELIILKLDFEKAFDKLEDQLMRKVMEQKGFGPRGLFRCTSGGKVFGRMFWAKRFGIATLQDDV